MIAMQPSYVHPAYKLTIPASFAKKYFEKKRDNALLRTVDGKTWSVVYNYDLSNGKVTAQIGHGWKEFAHENHLKVGDVCVFELINLKEEKYSNRKSMQRHSCSKVPEAVVAANKVTSLNPFFKVNIRSSHVEHGSLTVPVEFVWMYAKKSIENVTLQVASRQWTVKLLIYRSPHQGCFSAGWSSFAKENSIQVGDACIFEFVNSETMLLKVSILRNVK
ncbi:B3 domain-containing protein Os03g0212300-like [Ricinus communis]|uniref:B3 domain-containing protein Os03g0212300-like n=1 Tax=Ricinus communis TaxID=3988 RepID=UPI00201A9E72|nr:B3 domain-containing protein Os03g0212300-like [Ricinus communis]